MAAVQRASRRTAFTLLRQREYRAQFMRKAMWKTPGRKRRPR